MTNENQLFDKSSGLKYLVILFVFLVITELFYIYAADPDVEGTIMKFIFTGIPLIYVFYSHNLL